MKLTKQEKIRQYHNQTVSLGGQLLITPWFKTASLHVLAKSHPQIQRHLHAFLAPISHEDLQLNQNNHLPLSTDYMGTERTSLLKFLAILRCQHYI
jgi:hypothetical protein